MRYTKATRHSCALALHHWLRRKKLRWRYFCQGKGRRDRQLLRRQLQSPEPTGNVRFLGALPTVEEIIADAKSDRD